ncbi:MAG TPA: SUMF1/EgtB/PvdO family nonheme iron enzyme, partial [Polyangiaceae bacterium]|nr:SUMF1/EgtB/PvdO family nonheme iron enzyme [Polyangiaceae bacterium]
APALPRAAGAEASPHQALEGLCTAELPGRDRHPINCVDWASADAYCRRAGKRLPKPDEWEYAVRGGAGRTYPWGEEAPSANHLNGCGSECKRWGQRHHLALDALHAADDGFYGTAPVGTFPRGRSLEGVDDLLGNVMEWADEGAGDGGAKPAAAAPRLVMGTGWNVGSAAALRTPPRATLPGATRSHLVGFRCAASPRP